jgi:membrane protease subunit (stomatin/prohibitin family)
VRLRAFGNYTYRIVDPAAFHTKISGTRDVYTTGELDGQLRGMVLQHLSDGIAQSGIPFLDLAANQIEFARALEKELAPAFEAVGLKLEGMTVQNVSLPEELQKILDQRIGMGMVGNDMGKFIQYQTGQAIPEMAKAAGSGGGGGGSIAGDAMGLGAGIAMGQVLAQNMQQGLQGAQNQAAAAAASAAQAAAVRPEDVMATLEKLGELKTKGILTREEFDAKKAELLKKLV